MAVVGVAVFELHVPASRSLKDKRSVVRSLVQRLHQRHRISIAETGFQDLRQRAEISVAVVAASAKEADRVFDVLRSAAETLAEAELCNWRQETLDL